MNQFLKQLQWRWGIDGVMLGLIVASLILYSIAWWLGQTAIRFNSAAFGVAGGILVVNTVFIGMTARIDPLFGYVLGGVAVAVQCLLLILVTRATIGAGV